MAEERTEKNGPKQPQPPGSPRQPAVVPPGGQAIDPRVRIGVQDPAAREIDENEAKRNIARELDQIAQKMAAGMGNTPEERAAMAAEVDALKSRTTEVSTYSAGELDGLSDKLREEQPSDAYTNNPKSTAHAMLVQEVAKARDDIYASLAEDEGAEPKRKRERAEAR